MSERRRATKEDERALKSKLSLFIIILMIMSLTVCNNPAKQQQPAETPAPTEDATSARIADSGLLPAGEKTDLSNGSF